VNVTLKVLPVNVRISTHYGPAPFDHDLHHCSFGLKYNMAVCCGSQCRRKYTNGHAARHARLPPWHDKASLEWRTLQCHCSEGEVLGYDFNRMVVDFTMLNQGKMVKCAISTAAMDDLEDKHDVKPDQRVDQFVRLRDAIEERASRKFSERPVEAQGPVVLRSNDFR
jgi:hypothetical protein